jgi:hypothetical protein
MTYIISLFNLLHSSDGAADGARTRDNSDHNRVLYQLSYGRHSYALLSLAEGGENKKKLGARD